MSQEFDFPTYLMHHVSNSQEWKLPFLPAIHLPEPLSLHGVMLFICCGILFLVFCVLYKKDDRVPSGLTNFLEMIVLFVRDNVAIPNLGKEDGLKFTPFLCTLFFFILTLNLMGLIPLFSTATSNFSVTAALALVTFSFMVFGAIKKNGLKGFCKGLAPSGVPGFVLPLIVIIEILGLFIKPFALTVRLFANLLAGHIAIIAILGIITMFGAAAMPLLSVVLFIYGLEIMVAFIQSYIFTLLSAIFIGQMYHPEH